MGVLMRAGPRARRVRVTQMLKHALGAGRILGRGSTGPRQLASKEDPFIELK